MNLAFPKAFNVYKNHMVHVVVASLNGKEVEKEENDIRVGIFESGQLSLNSAQAPQVGVQYNVMLAISDWMFSREPKSGDTMIESTGYGTLTVQTISKAGGNYLLGCTATSNYVRR